MSNQKEVADIITNPNARPYNEQDDIDLIETIGFFWRSRVIIGISILFGITLALSLWVFNHQNVKMPIESRQWSLVYPVATGDDAVLATFAVLLEKFLKTQEGYQAFLDGVNIFRDDRSISTNEWITKQRNGNGMIKGISFQGSNATIVVQKPENWTVEDLKNVMPLGLNNAVRSFNRAFAEADNRLLQKQLRTQLELATSKIKALQLFDKYSGHSNGVQKSVLEGVGKELATSSRPEAITLLLAAVPDSDTQKSAVMQEYGEKLLIIESLAAQRRNLAKSLGTDSIASLVELGPVREIVPESVPSKGFGRLFDKGSKSIILGGILGGIVGVLASLLFAFWRSNRSRLQDIIRTT